jgi:hypothetical protein
MPPPYGPHPKPSDVEHFLGVMPPRLVGILEERGRWLAACVFWPIVIASYFLGDWLWTRSQIFATVLILVGWAAPAAGYVFYGFLRDWFTTRLRRGAAHTRAKRGFWGEFGPLSE